MAIDRAVLDRDFTICAEERVIIANRQGLAVQVDGDVRIDRISHKVFAIAQQDHSLAVLCRRDSVIVTRIRRNRVAVSIHDLCSHAGLRRESAVSVFINANALRYEARTSAFSKIVARVKVLKHTAIDCKARPASSITAIIAIQREAIRIATAFLLLDGEMTTVDRDFTSECIDCADIADIITGIYGQPGVLDIFRVISIHIQCEAVIFFRLECAAANSIIDRQITIVAHRDQRP